MTDSARREASKETTEVDETFLSSFFEKINDEELRLTMCFRLANCCSVCSTKCEQATFDKTDHLVRQICSNANHRLSSFCNGMTTKKTEKLSSSLAFETARKMVASHRDRQDFGKRFCNLCFDKLLLQHSEKSTNFIVDQQSEEVFLTCPFCYDLQNHRHRGLLQTDAMLSVLSPELMKTLSASLEREFVAKNYSVAFCSVKNCTYQQTMAKVQHEVWTQVRGPVFSNDQHILTCPEHGKRCTLCWKSVDVKHDCRGFPDEVALPESLKLVCRCPMCFSAVYRSEGCNHMTCRCGKQFNWEFSKVDIKQVAPKEEEVAVIELSKNIPKKEMQLKIQSALEAATIDEKKPESKYNLRKRKPENLMFYDRKKHLKMDKEEEEED